MNDRVAAADGGNGGSCFWGDIPAHNIDLGLTGLSDVGVFVEDTAARSPGYYTR
jgi:hypothetical protein